MSRLFKVNGLEVRKRALVEESDVYREMLKLQVRNLTLYSLSLRDKVQSPSGMKSLVLLALPFALKFFWRSPSHQKRIPKGWNPGRRLHGVSNGSPFCANGYESIFLVF